jgi:hypothetical protein
LEVLSVNDKWDWSALDVDDELAADVDVALPGGQSNGGMANISTTDLLSEVSAMTSLS